MWHDSKDNLEQICSDIMENELYVAPTVHCQEIGHWEEGGGEANMEREEAKPCVEIILWIRSAT